MSRLRRADPLDEILGRVLGEGAVIALGDDVHGTDRSPATRVIEAPADEAALASSLASVEDGAFDAALASDWSAELEPAAIARALSTKVRAGGVVAFAAPLARSGMRDRLLGLFRRRAPVELEALCEALLLARLVDIRAAEPDGRSGVAWARVPDPRA